MFLLKENVLFQLYIKHILFFQFLLFLYLFSDCTFILFYIKNYGGSHFVKLWLCCEGEEGGGAEPCLSIMDPGYSASSLIIEGLSPIVILHAIIPS